MSFAHPWWLLVLVPAAVIAVLDALRPWNATRLQRGLAVACRALIAKHHGKITSL